jgi:hypothetical protein
MRHVTVIGLVCAVSSLTQAQPSETGGAARFDGEWTITMSCPSNTEKSAARGYKRQFPARVKDGVLSGEIGAADMPGWLRIDGRIGADGSALLDAHGRTGDPDYAVNQPPPSSPYAFHVEARFEGARGSGRRLEARVCNFGFERR